jgi:hypothetical protein
MEVLAYIHVVYMYTRTMYCRFKIKLVVVGGTIAELCQMAALFASLQMYHLVKNILALTMTESKEAQCSEIGTTLFIWPAS